MKKIEAARASAALIAEYANQEAWTAVSKAIRAADAAKVSSTDAAAMRYACAARSASTTATAHATAARNALTALARLNPTDGQISRSRYFVAESTEAARIAELHALRAEAFFLNVLED